MLLLSQLSFAQKYTISGYIEDSASGERLIGASVYSSANMNFGTASNEYGFYSLTIPEGLSEISCTYIGYTSATKEFVLSNDTSFNIRLEASLELEEVTISSKSGSKPNPDRWNSYFYSYYPVEPIKKLTRGYVLESFQDFPLHHWLPPS